jgi:kynurenine formamidase
MRISLPPSLPEMRRLTGYGGWISIESAGPGCARYLAEETDILGIGVETVGTDAGAAPGFDPPFPCHSFLLGADKYGLTQLQRVGDLPVTGAVVMAAPLSIVGGSGSPARVLAFVERS